MKSTSAETFRKDENRTKRRAVEAFRRWLEEHRRRQVQGERDRRRKWLIFLLLMLFDTKPAQMFFPSLGAVPVQAPPDPNRSKLTRKKEVDVEEGGPTFDINEHLLFDCSPRPGEHHLHVVDGLTYADIIELNRIHRPHLFKPPAPVPGMPARYADARPHIWSLLDHLSSPYHRREALTALKLLIAPEARSWIDACAASDDGWKDLKRCRMKTPEMTIREFPRAAARWREQQHRDAEERKHEVEETSDIGPTPPGSD